MTLFSVSTPVCWTCADITSGGGGGGGVVHVFSVSAPVCWTCAVKFNIRGSL